MSNDGQLDGVDPRELDEGDEVIISDEGGSVRGVVEAKTTEWGRYGVTICMDDGESATCWERSGRTFHRAGGDDE